MGLANSVPTRINPGKGLFSAFGGLWRHFFVFRRYAGVRFYGLILLILMGGVVEGVGIGILVPVLNLAQGQPGTDELSKAVYSFMNFLGMPVTLLNVLLLLIIVFFIKGSMSYGQVITTSKLTTDLNMQLRKLLVSKYAMMDYGYFTKLTIGYLNNLVTTEVNRFVSGLGTFCALIGCSIYIVIFFSGAALLNSRMTGFVLFVSCMLIYAFRFLHRWSSLYSVKVTKGNARMQSVLIQLISNFKYLKATNAFNPLLKMFNAEISLLARFDFRLGALGGVLKAIFEPFLVVFMSLLVFYHIYLKGGELSELIIIIIFYQRTFSKVFGFQRSWQKFSACVGGVNAVEEAIERLDRNNEGKSPQGLASVSAVPGDITFNNVNYFYEDNQVLFDLNVRIRENETVAIVGKSGAGKTTFFDLLVGLLVPQSGAIMYRGISYDKIEKYDLRSRIGYVTQEPVVFNDTIANNISFWQCDSSNAECAGRIKDAADLTYCDEFISGMPGGLETMLGDRGVRLSGGQRQRIAIAREIFKNPDVLIFDEATSALDTESERYVQKSISKLKGSMTMIIIAHRLSTIIDCDYIYVLSQGRIVEEGTFDELHSHEGGIFREMCLAQSV